MITIAASKAPVVNCTLLCLVLVANLLDCLIAQNKIRGCCSEMILKLSEFIALAHCEKKWDHGLNF